MMPDSSLLTTELTTRASLTVEKGGAFFARWAGPARNPSATRRFEDSQTARSLHLWSAES